MNYLKTKLSFFIFPFIIVLYANSFLSAQHKDAHDIRRMFVYHFIKYIEWPKEETNNEFKIAVFEEGKMLDALKAKLNGAVRKGKPISVEKIDMSSSLEAYHVLYLPKSQSDMLEKLKEKAVDNHILFVTDKKGLSEKGSGINFKEINNKLKFEINTAELESRGLKVASQLKKVAIVL